MSLSDMAEADAAHREYLTETRRLVDEQVEALFRMITAVAERDGMGAGRVAMTRDGQTLTASAGDRTATFRVEAITDLPEGADRAHAFATSQARCIVQTAGGPIAEWELHRVGAGDTPTYAWMQAETQKAVDEAEVAAALRSVFA